MTWPGHPYAPEPEFCEFVAALVALTQPAVVVETGLGEGYLATAAAHLAPGEWVAYDTDPSWLKAPPVGVTATAEGPLRRGDAARADLTILDSLPERHHEIRLWADVAKPGALLIVHDPDIPIHRRAIDDAKLVGVTLPHPKGSFLAAR